MVAVRRALRGRVTTSALRRGWACPAPAVCPWYGNAGQGRPSPYETRKLFAKKRRIYGIAMQSYRQGQVPPGSGERNLATMHLCHNSSLSRVSNNVGVNAREKIGPGLPVARTRADCPPSAKISVENSVVAPNALRVIAVPSMLGHGRDARATTPRNRLRLP